MWNTFNWLINLQHRSQLSFERKTRPVWAGVKTADDGTAKIT